MKYRKDIDGLRAIAVISVIAFHSGIEVFSGGFVGVDIFFVISGYLITSIIYKDVKDGIFSFRNFFERRAARLLPALFITLAIVLLFGFILFDGRSFDKLGKEVFFSALGAANIHFANGLNYFVQDMTFNPLTHLWSLGIEKQFYLILPPLIVLFFKFSKKLIVYTIISLIFISFMLSIYSISQSQIKGYFLLHYRAFELFIGVFTALLKVSKYEKYKYFFIKKSHLSYIGFILIISPIFILSEKSSFPGFNALWPCIGTALVIAFPCQGILGKLLSSKVFVMLGLISYPLYLYHQPLISFIYYYEFDLLPINLFFVILIISTVGSLVTHKYIEIPVRRIVSKHSNKSLIPFISFLTVTLFFAFLGLIIAKTNGLESRYKLLNPFGAEITKAHMFSFRKIFPNSFEISDNNHSKVLFVGDSMVQQYIIPFSNLLNLMPEDVDLATKGGCILLKGEIAKGRVADMSYPLQNKLYAIKKTYDYVIISQSWEGYDSLLLNTSKPDGFEKWSKHLLITVNHFLTIAKKVIIIGPHPRVNGTKRIQPHLLIDKETYKKNLAFLEILNHSSWEKGRIFFERFNKNENITVIDPFSIFCSKNSSLKDENWSFFRDGIHITSASHEYVTKHIQIQLNKQYIKLRKLNVPSK